MTASSTNHHHTSQALAEAQYVVDTRTPHIGVGIPYAKLTSVGAMRCYTSSMVCLMAGGVYGLLRTPAKKLVDPLLVYSVTGVGE